MVAPIRVLHTESSPSLGGQELRILVEMEALSLRGFESVLVARPNTLVLHEARHRGLIAYALRMRNRCDPAAMWSFARIMRKHRIDIVNAHSSTDGWNCLPVARLLGVKTVRARHVGTRIAAGKISRLIYGPLCDRVLTTSESIKQGMVERGVPAGKIVCVPTGIPLGKYECASAGSLREDLGIPAEVPLVAQIAVLRGAKGPDVFVRGAEIAIANGCSAHFVLVGEGHRRAVIESLIARGGRGDRIKVAGFRRDIPEVLADIDVLVLAARTAEGVPQVILQAHAARVPVVATTVGGLAEVAIHEQTALCVLPNDAEGLAAAIELLLKHPARGRELAENGYRLTAGQYSLEAMAEKMAALYRGLLHRAANSSTAQASRG